MTYHWAIIEEGEFKTREFIFLQKLVQLAPYLYFPLSYPCMAMMARDKKREGRMLVTVANVGRNEEGYDYFADYFDSIGLYYCSAYIKYTQYGRAPEWKEVIKL